MNEEATPTSFGSIGEPFGMSPSRTISVKSNKATGGTLSVRASLQMFTSAKFL